MLIFNPQILAKRLKNKVFQGQLFVFTLYRELDQSGFSGGLS